MTNNEKIKIISAKEDELLGMVKDSELRFLVNKLRNTSARETKVRELILEDMNVILKDMKAIMLELYKMNEE